MSTEIERRLRDRATDEVDWKCTNSHDLCQAGTSAGSECPYCDKSITSDGELLTEAADELARLRLENSALARACKAHTDGHKIEVAELEGDITRLRTLLASALAGLEPFGMIGDVLRKQGTGDDSPWIDMPDDQKVSVGWSHLNVTVGDLRRAAEVATEIRKELNDG